MIDDLGYQTHSCCSSNYVRFKEKKKNLNGSRKYKKSKMNQES